MLLLDSGSDRSVVTESVKSRLTCPGGNTQKYVLENRNTTIQKERW
jgi:hypothetical protein